MSKRVTLAILDFCRPIESRLCLDSIKQYAKFNHEVVFLTNGTTNPEYAYKFYEFGLVDKLIIRRKNEGCGWGMRELMNDFDLNSDYIILIQCDQFLGRELNQEEIDKYIELLESKEYCCIDMAGSQCGERFSERVFMMDKNFYNSIPNDIGGPGIHSHSNKWTEECVQDFIEKNNLKIYHAKISWADNGVFSIRDYLCGGRTLHRTDTKQLWIIKPLKEKYDNLPSIELTEDEWKTILEGKWVNGTTPIKQVENSHVVWRIPEEHLNNTIRIASI